MPRIKSLITHIEIDEALRSHYCQASKKHRISQGDKRLKVKNQRGWDHYCLECAKRILLTDINKLTEYYKGVLSELNK